MTRRTERPPAASAGCCTTWPWLAFNVLALEDQEHVERANWTLRGHMRRMTRLSNGFSRKRANLQAALALYFAYYNFCRMHRSIKMTPAMAAGITRKVWTMADLLTASRDSTDLNENSAAS
jgi:hypothetical protein